jgi:hypothetical protein
VGLNSGPFTLLNEDDFPAVLAHAESLVAESGEEFGVETPLINRKAIQYFSERKYRMDAFTVLFMSNEPFGRLKTICASLRSSLCDSSVTNGFAGNFRNLSTVHPMHNIGGAR